MNQPCVWKGKEALLPYARGSVFFEGTFSEPQLNHPEGIAVDSEGNIWCGGEKGEIFRIDKNGGGIELMASTGGFTLGLAFDTQGFLYSCDNKHKAVFRFNPKNGELVRFADGDGGVRIPNVPLVDEKNGFLYVSDSYDSDREGPGIWRFDLETGKGGLWYRDPLRFANGLVMLPGGDALAVAETFKRTVSKIPIRPDGTPGKKETIVEIDALPDGLTLDDRGRLYISCYEPSLLYRVSDQNDPELLFYDPEAHLLCHPTNCAFRGGDLFVSNLGRWHITKIENVLLT